MTRRAETAVAPPDSVEIHPGVARSALAAVPPHLTPRQRRRSKRLKRKKQQTPGRAVPQRKRGRQGKTRREEAWCSLRKGTFVLARTGPSSFRYRTAATQICRLCSLRFAGLFESKTTSSAV